MKLRKKITREILPYCAECRVCVLECSFHHLKKYQPSASSIDLERDSRSLRVLRTIYHTAMDGHIPCDDCAGEPEKICRRYCPMESIEKDLKEGGTG